MFSNHLYPLKNRYKTQSPEGKNCDTNQLYTFLTSNSRVDHVFVLFCSCEVLLFANGKVSHQSYLVKILLPLG